MKSVYMLPGITVLYYREKFLTFGCKIWGRTFQYFASYSEKGQTMFLMIIFPLKTFDNFIVLAH